MLGVLAIEIRWESWHLFFPRHVLFNQSREFMYRKRMENIRKKKQPKIRFPWQHFKIRNAQLHVSNWGLQGKIYPTFC